MLFLCLPLFFNLKIFLYYFVDQCYSLGKTLNLDESDTHQALNTPPPGVAPITTEVFNSARSFAGGFPPGDYLFYFCRFHLKTGFEFFS